MQESYDSKDTIQYVPSPMMSKVRKRMFLEMQSGNTASMRSLNELNQLPKQTPKSIQTKFVNLPQSRSVVPTSRIRLEVDVSMKSRSDDNRKPPRVNKSDDRIHTSASIQNATINLIKERHRDIDGIVTSFMY
ncbi:hypothetical protein R6Q57_003592 [Mikania cordata]